jgi:hypothetical protein
MSRGTTFTSFLHLRNKADGSHRMPVAQGIRSDVTAPCMATAGSVATIAEPAERWAR